MNAQVAGTANEKMEVVTLKVRYDREKKIKLNKNKENMHRKV